MQGMADRRIGALIGAVVAGVLLAGCGGGEPKELQAGEIRVLVGERTNSGNDALLSGALSDVSGCLGVDNFAVIWPHGTEVASEDPLAVSVPGWGRVGLGDPVELGGGMITEGPQSDPVHVGELTVPDECAEHGVWGAWN
ncbi:hypothetical protein [Flavimobilis marinus]|nr:hypothetical protein [Flavimobilis marinus]